MPPVKSDAVAADRIAPMVARVYRDGHFDAERAERANGIGTFERYQARVDREAAGPFDGISVPPAPQEPSWLPRHGLSGKR